MAIDDLQQGTLLPLTVTDAAERLRAGELTSVALTSALMARADALDPMTGTYVTRFDDHALAQAAQADADFAGGIDKGPYQGIPIGIKDILAVAEGRTTANSLILDPEWGAGKEGPVVRRLKEAGAVITGKLTTSEFAIGSPDSSKPFAISEKSLESRSVPRRVECRNGERRRIRSDHGRDRHRHRRQHPDPGSVEWRDRPDADVRTGPEVRLRTVGLQPRSHRAPRSIGT